VPGGLAARRKRTAAASCVAWWPALQLTLLQADAEPLGACRSCMCILTRVMHPLIAEWAPPAGPLSFSFRSCTPMNVPDADIAGIDCSNPPAEKLDAFAIIKFPLTTESAMKKIEDNNTLVSCLVATVLLQAAAWSSKHRASRHHTLELPP